MFRFLVALVAAGTIALSTGILSPASSDAAQLAQCKDRLVTAAGVGHGILGFATRGAKRNAISTWQQMVSLKYGARYATWENAENASVQCGKTLFKVQCLAIASPCQA